MWREIMEIKWNDGEKKTGKGGLIKGNLVKKKKVDKCKKTFRKNSIRIWQQKYFNNNCVQIICKELFWIV